MLIVYDDCNDYDDYEINDDDNEMKIIVFKFSILIQSIFFQCCHIRGK